MDARDHYNDVTMNAMASQITSASIVYSTAQRHMSNKTSKLRVTGVCEANSPVNSPHRVSNASNVSI